jgi:hypothetical protein
MLGSINEENCKSLDYGYESNHRGQDDCCIDGS